MKKNGIAMMLSLALAGGSVGGAPVLAAETISAEAASAEVVQTVGDEEAAAPEVSEENEDTDTGGTHEDASGEETAQEETEREEDTAQEEELTQEAEEEPAQEAEEEPAQEEGETSEEAPEAVDDAGQEESEDLSGQVPADEVITDAAPESIPVGEPVEEIVTVDSNKALGYVMGSDIVEYARQYVGRVPYVHGAGNNKDISDLTGGTDCNGFVCGVFFHFDINLWPYRIKIRNSPLLTNIGTDLSKAQPGDILYWEETIPGAGNGHVAIYDGSGWMVHETTDSYNGMSSNVLYTPVSLVSSGWPISGIYRAADVLAEPPLPKVHGTTPIDIGGSFYAYIRNQASNLYLTNQKDNIAGEEFTGENTQVWRFQRQSNEAYVITSIDDNACMDVISASHDNGANVYAYNRGFVGEDNQQFYIYWSYDAYYISPAHTNGSHALNMSSTTHNLEIWDVKEDWAPQEFDIEKVTYTVKYDANGGSKAPSSQTKEYNKDLTLRDSVPVRDGCDFLGWASDKNATASEYDPGATYTANKDITLYAVWQITLGKTARGDMFNLAKSVKVTWKAVPGAQYYKVYREGITDKKETQKEPVIVTKRLIGWDTQPGLTNGHKYRYKIVASRTGKGDPSGDSLHSYSKEMYRLKTVVIRSAKNTEPGKITVKYDKTTGGDGYVLQFCEREDMVGAKKTKVVRGANNTSYTIGGLKKGKTYYISIRVRKKVKGIDYYTTFGVPRKVTVTK